jgi:hypothetical protein
VAKVARRAIQFAARRNFGAYSQHEHEKNVELIAFALPVSKLALGLLMTR